MFPSRWVLGISPVPLLVFHLVGAATCPARAEPQQVSQRLREAFEKHQGPETVHGTLAQHLRRLVEADAEFDPKRQPETLGLAMRTKYYGLQPLLDDTLNTQFLGLSSDSLRGEWLRRYWVLRDPTPTTPVNERLLEHDRRVRFARENFAMAEPPYWDDRGSFCLLYGPPETSRHVPADVHHALGYRPEQMQWFYGSSRMLVRFTRHKPPDGPWRLGISEKGFSNRPHTIHKDAGHGVTDLADGFGPPETFYDEESRTRPPQMDPEYAGWEDLSMAPASEVMESHRERFVLPGPPRDSLWFVFDTDSFRLPGAADSDGVSSCRLETHVQFVVSDLRFQREDSLYTAHYRVEGVLLDENLREAARDAYEMKLPAKRFDTTALAHLWPGQLGFKVAPGKYRMALRLADLRSGGEGSYVTDVRIPAPGDSRLALSDIELATAITPAQGFESSRFAKNGRLVLPNPIGFYSAAQPLTAYFEIYGLTLEEAGGRYRVSYQIVARPDDAKPGRAEAPQPSVTASFVSTCTVTDPVEELRIDIRNLPETKYEIIIQVQDLVAGGEATARTNFTVIRL